MSTRLVIQPFLRSLLSMAVLLAPSLATAQDAVRSKAAAEPVASAPLAIDVALQADGLLIGQLVGATGKPEAGAKVQLTLADGREAEAKTNADGGFAFKGVHGVARLESDKAALLVRSWTAQAAPPNATPAVLLVEQGEVARGQRYAGTGVQNTVSHSKRLLANPLFVAGVIGTAVAIPVAIHNSDDDDPAS
ncbi:hypothetical protein Pla108_37370 [Botrimarina colliarenosi]|uniref:Nickel uptake substrate-specific transmembrane region n=1 Tax=Botrimarina colliarenosi TaxID=2528001 RepID=A0A5C6A3P6_9BACT|nr:carboxypeptidase-like regulatory domain-containing protein [Botrimarina colliarenosi]TWT94026.1 hypothetical protein Pla108_37370 [Botrimarina colliarenosi]